jgi:hypothetical protein
MKTVRGVRKRIRTLQDGGERGSVIVIAMVFVMIFIIIGVALYWLISSQTRSTETERTDVKAFNVAEAGVDAGMLALKLDWPRHDWDVATVDNDLLKQVIQENTEGLWDPSRSDASEFIQVNLYDNVDSDGNTTTVADPAAPKWDSNGDGMMFVDASSNVDDDRHRILILAERQKWALTFPFNLALWASTVDSNGQGLEIKIEDGTPPVYFDVHDSEHKGIDPQDGVQQTGTSTNWEEVFASGLGPTIAEIAKGMNMYFDGADAVAQAEAALSSGEANGKIVYIKSDSAVEIEGNTQIGTVDDPVLVVLDTPDGSVNTWDMKGTADFYGVLVSLGDSTLRGTCGIHGAMYCKNIVSNKGNGSSGEINYNQKVIANINGQYVISVNIVPNTWEEYTLPKTASAGP